MLADRPRSSCVSCTSEESRNLSSGFAAGLKWLRRLRVLLLYGRCFAQKPIVMWCHWLADELASFIEGPRQNNTRVGATVLAALFTKPSKQNLKLLSSVFEMFLNPSSAVFRTTSFAAPMALAGGWKRLLKALWCRVSG